jgi:tetratricopeptide (TPR) repeat protein
MNYQRPWWWVLLLFIGFGVVAWVTYYNDRYTTQRATSLSVKGDAAGAIQEYTRYLKMFPNDHDALFGRGQNYMKADQTDLAIADFSKALELRPNSLFYRSARASAYYAKTDYENAIADLTIEIGEEQNWGSLSRRGMAYQRAGRFNEALADFEAFLSHSPNYTYKHVIKARDCARQKTNEGECRALSEFPDPEQMKMLDKFGRCQFQHKCD